MHSLIVLGAVAVLTWSIVSVLVHCLDRTSPFFGHTVAQRCRNAGLIFLLNIVLKGGLLLGAVAAWPILDRVWGPLGRVVQPGALEVIAFFLVELTFLVAGFGLGCLAWLLLASPFVSKAEMYRLLSVRGSGKSRIIDYFYRLR